MFEGLVHFVNFSLINANSFFVHPESVIFSRDFANLLSLKSNKSLFVFVTTLQLN